VAYTGAFELHGSNDPTGAFKATQTIISATDHLTGLRAVLSRVGTIRPVGLQVPLPGSFILMTRSRLGL